LQGIFARGKKIQRKEDTDMIKRRAHRWAFPVGVILVLLAVVGAVSLVNWLVKGVREQIANPKEKQYYEAFLKNVVMNDPDPFDDVGSANMPQLIDISIWSLLDSDRTPQPKNYPMDEGSTLVPQEHVEQEFARLFGTVVKPLHSTVEGSQYEFIYDAAEKCYRIPVTGMLQMYLPRVERIEKQGNSVLLTVNYIGAADWDRDSDGKSASPGKIVEPEPIKQMLITLHVEDDKMTVGAIQAPEQQEIAGDMTRIPVPTTSVPAPTTTAVPTSAAVPSTPAKTED
jgi:hypothetical protein